MDRLNITHQAKRKGFNLIEAAIVLGVVGAVLGGIWWAASAFRTQSIVNDSVNDIDYFYERFIKIYPKETDDVLSFSSDDPIADYLVHPSWKENLSDPPRFYTDSDTGINYAFDESIIYVFGSASNDYKLDSSICNQLGNRIQSYFSTKNIQAYLDIDCENGYIVLPSGAMRWWDVGIIPDTY